MKLWEVIQELCALPGVSGGEGPVREALLKHLQGHCACSVDALGNLIAFKKGQKAPKGKLMLAAPMDEAGFIITFVEESGLLRFEPVGKADSRAVLGKAVEIGAGAVPGVIGTKPVHLQEEKERSQVLGTDKLYIDIGARGKEEALKAVKPGALAVFRSGCGGLGEHKIFGRALDSRAPCALLLALAEKELPVDCTFVFAAKSKAGSAGAAAAAYSQKPGAALVLEGFAVADFPGVSPEKMAGKLGDGPVLSYVDKGAVFSRELSEAALEAAGKTGLPFQVGAPAESGGARAIQAARGGVQVLGLGLACRNLNTKACVMDMRDIENTLPMLERLLKTAAGL